VLQGERISRTLTSAGSADTPAAQAAKTKSKENRGIFKAIEQVDRQFKRESQRKKTMELHATSWKWRLIYAAYELTHHRYFSYFVGFVIALNAVHIGVETNHEAHSAPGNEVKNEDHWLNIEVLFAVIFLAELILRLIAERREFFFDGWNCFDFLLVACSCFDTFILGMIEADSNHVKIITVLRIMRLVRLARIFRLLRFFKELWLLVSGIAGAMRTLVWAFLLLGVIIYVSAILLFQVLGQPYKDDDPDIDMYFGSLEITMFTNFQLITLEGWATICRVAMVHESWSWMFFVLYLSTTTFGIMNIVVAVIVENTVEQATKRQEDVHKKAEQEQKMAAEKISEIFVASDANHDGEVTKQEFCAAMEREDVMRYLQQIGIDVRQAENLFDILDYDESGSLDAQEFTQGVLKARGEAKARDLLTVQCDLWRYEQKFRKDLYELCENMNDKCSSVDEEVALIREDLLRIIQPSSATNGSNGAAYPATNGQAGLSATMPATIPQTGGVTEQSTKRNLESNAAAAE
jgi:voltage-gated sodium channel